MATVRRSESMPDCWPGGAEGAARNSRSSPQPAPSCYGFSARKSPETCSHRSVIYGAANTFILSSSFLSTWLPLVSSNRQLSSQRKTRREKIWASMTHVVNTHPGKCCAISSRTGWVAGITVRRAENQSKKLWLEVEHQDLLLRGRCSGNKMRVWGMGSDWKRQVDTVDLSCLLSGHLLILPPLGWQRHYSQIKDLMGPSAFL